MRESKNTIKILAPFAIIGFLVLTFVIVAIYSLSRPKGEKPRIIDAQSVKEIKQYYKGLPKPQRTPEQVIAEMETRGGLDWNNEDLIQSVRWFVYHGNEQVIDQLISNLSDEVDLKVIRGKDYESVSISDEGKSYETLSHAWWPPPDADEQIRCHGIAILPTICPVLHRRMHKIAHHDELKPELLFLVLKLIEENEPKVFEADPKTTTFGVYEHVKICGNTGWYTSQTVLEDVCAYLKIYIKYQHHPLIRRKAANHFLNYPGIWLSHVDKNFFLKLAEDKDPNYAPIALAPAIKPLPSNELADQLKVLKTMAIPEEQNLPFLCCTQSHTSGNWQPVQNWPKPASGKPIAIGDLQMLTSYCPHCLSIRLLNTGNFTIRILESGIISECPCNHHWMPGIHAWSLENLKQGDYLFIVYDAMLFVIRIGPTSKNETLTYSISNLPLSKLNGTRVDLNKLAFQQEKQKLSFLLADRSLPFRFTKGSSGGPPCLHIWYDYYYGGFPSKTSFWEKPMFIAVAHPADLHDNEPVDLSSFRFKTWEDGLGNLCKFYRAKKAGFRHPR